MMRFLGNPPIGVIGLVIWRIRLRQVRSKSGETMRDGHL
jgi:hypothetical protein